MPQLLFEQQIDGALGSPIRPGDGRDVSDIRKRPDIDRIEPVRNHKRAIVSFGEHDFAAAPRSAAVKRRDQREHSGVAHAVLNGQAKILTGLDLPAVDPGGNRLGRLQMRNQVFEKSGRFVDVLLCVAQEDCYRMPRS
jgi:hypothetical protein